METIVGYKFVSGFVGALIPTATTVVFLVLKVQESRLNPNAHPEIEQSTRNSGAKEIVFSRRVIWRRIWTYCSSWGHALT